MQIHRMTKLRGYRWEAGVSRFTENKTVISRTFQFIMFHDILHDDYRITIPPR